MALKRTIDKAAYDTLSDELKAEYKKSGTDYVLQTEGDEDTGALKRAHDRTKQELTEAKGKLNATETELDELKASRTDKDRDIDRLTRAHDAALKKVKDESAATIAARDTFIKETLVDNVATALAGQISKAPKLLVPHIKSRLIADLSGEKPTTKILDKDGKPSDLTLDKLKEEFVANPDYAAIIIGSKASGGGAPRLPLASGGAQQSEKPALLSELKGPALVAELKARQAERTA